MQCQHLRLRLTFCVLIRAFEFFLNLEIIMIVFLSFRPYDPLIFKKLKAWNLLNIFCSTWYQLAVSPYLTWHVIKESANIIIDSNAAAMNTCNLHDLNTNLDHPYKLILFHMHVCSHWNVALSPLNAYPWAAPNWF